MAYPDDLLALASQLADFDAEHRNQAILRRAVSTAYYALFHLLISEATLNWARPELRPALGRVFDHGKMKSASEAKRAAVNAQLKSGSSTIAVSLHLRTVAEAFIQVQDKRNEADYDIAKEWTLTEVKLQIAAVNAAFESWNVIREERDAQAYLVSLLVKRPRSE